ncbi:MAG: MFS transporter [Thermodesulfobacteriota bacterium]
MAAPFGIRKVVFISLLVIGISLFLTYLANSFLFAFFTRLIAGAGNGGSYVPIMALPAAWFVYPKRELATGIVSGGIGTGLFLSGIILPPIISGFGKEGSRYAWFFLGISVFALAFLWYAFLRPREKALSMYGGEEEQKGGAKLTLFSAFKDVRGRAVLWLI